MILLGREIDSIREASRTSISPLCDFSKCPRKGTFVVFFTRVQGGNQDRARVCGDHLTGLVNGSLDWWKFKRGV